MMNPPHQPSTPMYQHQSTGPHQMNQTPPTTTMQPTTMQQVNHHASPPRANMMPNPYQPNTMNTPTTTAPAINPNQHYSPYGSSQFAVSSSSPNSFPSPPSSLTSLPPPARSFMPDATQQSTSILQQPQAPSAYGRLTSVGLNGPMTNGHSHAPHYGSEIPSGGEFENGAAAFDVNDPTVSTTTEFMSSYAILNSIETVNAMPLPLGLLLAPAVHLYPAPPRFQQPVQQCRTCQAYIQLHARIVPSSNPQQPTSQWICTFCHTSQPFQTKIHQYVVQPPQPTDPNSINPVSAPNPATPIPAELAYRVIETVTPTSEFAPILPPTVFPPSNKQQSADLFSPLSTGSGLNFCFLLDRHLSKTDMTELKRSLTSFIQELPNDAGLALITFSNTVTIYDLTQTGMAAGQVMTGEIGPTMEELEYYIQEHGVVFPRVSRVRANFLECLDSLEQSSHTFEQQKLFNPRAIGAAAEWCSALVQAGREYDTMTRTAASKGKTSNSPSHLPTSNETSGMAFACTHVTIITSGPPDFGPGETTLEVSTNENDAALRYYHDLGVRAHANQMTCDYFAYGQGNFSVPIVRKLIEPTGGSIFIHQSFQAAFLNDLRASIFRAIGYGGELDIFLSPELSMTHIIGGVTQISQIEQKKGKEEESKSADGDDQDILTVPHLRLNLAHCRPDLSLGLYYTLKEDLPQDYVYLQFVFTYRDWNHQCIRRIMTRRLRTTGNNDTFLRSMDVKVIGILIAKQFVLRAVQGEQREQTQKEIDSLVRATCKYFHRAELTLTGSTSTNAYQTLMSHLPSELHLLPILFFHLRRGIWIGPILQHADDIDYQRFIFLHANRNDAVRLALPTLLAFNQQGGIEEFPLETLALQSNRILFLDHQTQILIWSGHEMTSSVYDAYRSACIQRATSQAQFRLPQPEFILCTENSSAARWIQARLIPTHKDEPEWQNTTFPQLRLISPTERQDLLAKFLPTDELSFVQYYQSTIEPVKK